jgi:hypothetical protein
MTAAGPSSLVLAVVAAAYVLVAAAAVWARHHRADVARRWQTEHTELMRELEHYERADDP